MSSARDKRKPRAYGPVATESPADRPGEDAVDRHVRRWSGWDALTFDPDIEAAVTRIQHIDRYLTRTTREAVAEVGLESHEYQTLHHLLIRDTPGYAATGDLARSAGVSAAAMTTRIDRLAQRGLVTRRPSEDDRRVIEVQVTDAGYARWHRAMNRRGAAEAALFAEMPAQEVARLATLLRKALLAAEAAQRPSEKEST